MKQSIPAGVSVVGLLVFHHLIAVVVVRLIYNLFADSASSISVVAESCDAVAGLGMACIVPSHVPSLVVLGTAL